MKIGNIGVAMVTRPFRGPINHTMVHGEWILWCQHKQFGLSKHLMYGVKFTIGLAFINTCKCISRLNPFVLNYYWGSSSTGILCLVLASIIDAPCGHLQKFCSHVIILSACNALQNYKRSHCCPFFQNWHEDVRLNVWTSSNLLEVLKTLRTAATKLDIP